MSALISVVRSSIAFLDSIRAERRGGSDMNQCDSARLDANPTTEGTPARPETHEGVHDCVKRSDTDWRLTLSTYTKYTQGARGTDVYS